MPPVHRPMTASGSAREAHPVTPFQQQQPPSLNDVRADGTVGGRLTGWKQTNTSNISEREPNVLSQETLRGPQGNGPSDGRTEMTASASPHQPGEPGRANAARHSRQPFTSVQHVTNSPPPAQLPPSRLHDQPAGIPFDTVDSGTPESAWSTSSQLDELGRTIHYLRGYKSKDLGFYYTCPAKKCHGGLGYDKWKDVVGHVMDQHPNNQFKARIQDGQQRSIMWEASVKHFESLEDCPIAGVAINTCPICYDPSPLGSHFRKCHRRELGLGAPRKEVFVHWLVISPEGVLMEAGSRDSLPGTPLYTLLSGTHLPNSSSQSRDLLPPGSRISVKVNVGGAENHRHRTFSPSPAENKRRADVVDLTCISDSDRDRDDDRDGGKRAKKVKIQRRSDGRDTAPAAELKTNIPRRQDSPPQTQLPSAPSPESFSYKYAEDVYRCGLCSRQWASHAALQRHEKLSDMHRDNLQNGSKLSRARSILTRLRGSTATGSTASCIANHAESTAPHIHLGEAAVSTPSSAVATNAHGAIQPIQQAAALGRSKNAITNATFPSTAARSGGPWASIYPAATAPAAE